MGKKLSVLDTNIIIRYLTDDTPQQAESVKKLFQRAPAKSLFIPDLIVAEIAYVLLSFYELPKPEVVEKINTLLDFDKIRTNKKLLKKTLELFSAYNISFADAYLCSYSILGKSEDIYTFDKNIRKVSGVKTKEL